MLLVPLKTNELKYSFWLWIFLALLFFYPQNSCINPLLYRFFNKFHQSSSVIHSVIKQNSHYSKHSIIKIVIKYYIICYLLLLLLLLLLLFTRVSLISLILHLKKSKMLKIYYKLLLVLHVPLQFSTEKIAKTMIFLYLNYLNF